MKIKFNSLGYAINYVFILIFFDEKCIYANRIFQNITFICFHEDEKNWNNTVILDQLVFYSSRVQCSNSIQFYGSCTVVKALAKIADEFSERATVYIYKDSKLSAPFVKFVDPVKTSLGGCFDRVTRTVQGSYKWIVMYERCKCPDSNAFQLK